ncbi:DNA-deoxyinosine glycosylase [Cohnella sp. AR92]|uniref:DNA-deoxyinosine glycosylase n=1 Tax=Cohnella sp. AR92 TaxID=648716 RepID=UPI000F8D6D25|nr:DNA-deoxyinosine glycosylase [Cohnella sp. AR92]RUS48649.1 DNA-deoxyinosine glycosylase [Cohnella sp. AR92]
MEKSPIVHSFPPIADEQSRILFLGSMPGVRSLEMNQYYGNPRNFFWRLLFELLGEGAERAAETEYEERLAFARRHGIAMWDVIEACNRPGSLDSDIRNAVPNEVPGLLRRYPNIQVIACNGSKSHTELLKQYGDTPELRSRTVLRLPSSSPVPTPKFRGLEDRLAVWREILSPFLIPSAPKLD